MFLTKEKQSLKSPFRAECRAKGLQRDYPEATHGTLLHSSPRIHTSRNLGVPAAYCVVDYYLFYTGAKTKGISEHSTQHEQTCAGLP